jgi:hypothetical protein
MFHTIDGAFLAGACVAPSVLKRERASDRRRLDSSAVQQNPKRTKVEEPKKTGAQKGDASEADSDEDKRMKAVRMECWNCAPDCKNRDTGSTNHHVAGM